MSDQEFAFSDLGIARRPGKPRKSGLTFIFDFNFGPVLQRDFLEYAGDFVDLAKFPVGTVGFLRKGLIETKIDQYREFDVEPFFGGQFLEYALFHRGLDAADWFLDQTRQMGFNVVEISDNCLDLPLDKKISLIRKAQGDFGFVVLAEVGKKTGSTAIGSMVDSVAESLASGATKVLVEAMELYDAVSARPKEALVNALRKNFDMKDLVIEMPGPWTPNMTTNRILDIQHVFVDTFGAEVNLANVAPERVVQLEARRTRGSDKLE